MENTTKGIIEILCLNLKPGTCDAFNKLYMELALPLLKLWDMDVLCFGPSLHEEDTYLVVRRYKDLADRQQSQEAYYGSNDWKQGPGETIMAFIENYTTVVIATNDTLIAGLRRANSNKQAG